MNKKLMSAFLALTTLCSCETISKAADAITTRALRNTDFSYSTSDTPTSISVAVKAKNHIKLITITFDWLYLDGNLAKEEIVTEKEIENGEGRNFTSTIDWTKALAIKGIKYEFTGTAYI